VVSRERAGRGLSVGCIGKLKEGSSFSYSTGRKACEESIDWLYSSCFNDECRAFITHSFDCEENSTHFSAVFVGVAGCISECMAGLREADKTEADRFLRFLSDEGKETVRIDFRAWSQEKKKVGEGRTISDR